MVKEVKVSISYQINDTENDLASQLLADFNTILTLHYLKADATDSSPLFISRIGIRATRKAACNINK